MPNIPYPEFNDFHVELTRKVIQGTQPVEGFAFLSMNALPNCVRDILIACRCCFRYRTDDGTTHTVLLHEEIQRNATPFDDAGIPEGEYEFPFSFSFPEQLPPSVVVTGGWDTLCNCRLWYEIRAYVMHAENHPALERKHLRTSVKFQRETAYGPGTEIAPSVDKKDYVFKSLDVRAELDKDVYVHGEPIFANITVKSDLIRQVHAIKLAVKQVITVRKRAMRQVREFVIKHTVGTAEATGKGIPIKRHQTYTGRVSVIPEYRAEEVANMHGGIALCGKLNQNAPPTLAPSIKRHTPEGIEVQYFLQISFCVMLSADFVVTIPFTLSDALPNEENTAPPSYWAQSELSAPLHVAAEEPEQDEGEGPLPTYDEATDANSQYRRLGMQSAMYLRHHGNTNRRQIGMSRVQIPGSTDDFNNMAHNLDGTRGHRPSEMLENMPEITEESLASDIVAAANIITDNVEVHTVRRATEPLAATRGRGEEGDDQAASGIARLSLGAISEDSAPPSRS